MPSADSDVPYVGLDHIEAESGRLVGFGRAGDTVSLKTPFEVGDILYGKLRPALRKVLRAPMCGVASTEILAIVPSQSSDAAFVEHMLHSDQVLAWALQGAEGTKMPRTSWDRLARYEFLCPPPQERQRIGEVLDAIDEAVEKTEAVIAATDQLRKALLQELLTRGVPGWHTEWKTIPGIGTIPACWEVAPLGDVAEVTSGIALGPHRRPAANPVPYLTVANVQADAVDLGETRHMELSAKESSERRLRSGDLVMVEGHAQVAQLGRAAIVPESADGFTFQNHLFRVRAHEGRALNTFLAAFINGTRGRDYFAQFGGTTSGLNTVNTTNVRAMRLALPPVDEQARSMMAIAAVDDGLAAYSGELEGLRWVKQSAAGALLSGRVRVSIRAEATA